MPGILPFSIELRRPQSCVAHGANQAVCSAGRNNCQMSPSSVILPTATLSLWVSITISGIERLPGTLIQSFSNVNPDNSSGVPNYYHLHLNTISWAYLVTSRLQIYQPWSYRGSTKSVIQPITMPEEEPSLNIPSLLTLAVVSFFVIRWFLKRDGSSDPGAPRARGRGNIVDPAQVEQIAQMFPQLSTREIMWDLQRNGGNVAATTERILSGRGLDMVRTGGSPICLSPADCRRCAARARFDSY